MFICIGRQWWELSCHVAHWLSIEASERRKQKRKWQKEKNKEKHCNNNNTTQSERAKQRTQQQMRKNTKQITLRTHGAESTEATDSSQKQQQQHQHRSQKWRAANNKSGGKLKGERKEKDQFINRNYQIDVKQTISQQVRVVAKRKKAVGDRFYFSSVFCFVFSCNCSDRIQIHRFGSEIGFSLFDCVLKTIGWSIGSLGAFAASGNAFSHFVPIVDQISCCFDCCRLTVCFRQVGIQSCVTQRPYNIFVPLRSFCVFDERSQFRISSRALQCSSALWLVFSDIGVCDGAFE